MCLHLADLGSSRKRIQHGTVLGRLVRTRAQTRPHIGMGPVSAYDVRSVHREGTAWMCERWVAF